jgi:hypothetical protein
MGKVIRAHPSLLVAMGTGNTLCPSYVTPTSLYRQLIDSLIRPNHYHDPALL